MNLCELGNFLIIIMRVIEKERDEWRVEADTLIPCVATDEFTCSMLLEGIANLLGNYA